MLGVAIEDLLPPGEDIAAELCPGRGIDHQQAVDAGGAEAGDGRLVPLGPGVIPRPPFIGDVEDDVLLVLLEPCHVRRFQPAVDDGVQRGEVKRASRPVVLDDRDDPFGDELLDDLPALRRGVGPQARGEHDPNRIRLGLGELREGREVARRVAPGLGLVDPSDEELVPVGVVDIAADDVEARARVARGAARAREQEPPFQGFDRGASDGGCAVAAQPPARGTPVVGPGGEEAHVESPGRIRGSRPMPRPCSHQAQQSLSWILRFAYAPQKLTLKRTSRSL